MASAQSITEKLPAAPQPAAANGDATTKAQKRGPSLHQVYARPAPIRTFPLPAFHPNNPISLFQLAYTWISQVFRPPPKEPAVVHIGTWSPESTSVIIKDEASIRALWEQGFYGKGSLSRSEPNWLKREQLRRGLQAGHVSEVVTVQRREERAEAKWERARLEQAAIRQTRLEEARQAEARQSQKSSELPSAPTGPLQLLALPNSAAALDTVSGNIPHDLPSPTLPSVEETPKSGLIGLHRLSSARAPEPTPSPSENGGDSDGRPQAPPRQKSVRFSREVQSTTFQVTDPPSRNHSPNGSVRRGAAAQKSQPVSDPEVIVNMEHLQLTPEEAFCLSFGFGVLTINDPVTGSPMGSKDLLTTFRQHSFAPPRIEPDDPALQPDDNFLIHYAVYHHFRSLGWVPRAGIKFGVDWLLYARGPVFDHAEFGLIVLPSYTDAWWKEHGKRSPEKTWHWMHKIVRVLSHVTKSLVIVYVEVPSPEKFDAAMETGFAEALALYQVREIMVKRWSSNRNR